MQREHTYKKYLPVIITAAVLYTLFVILSFQTAGGVYDAFDRQLEQIVYSWRTPALNTFVELITTCGNTASIICLILLLLALPKTRYRYGLPVFTAAILTTLIKAVVKETVERPRPDEIYRLIEETGWSFPSGHTITSIAVYGLLAWLIWYYHKRDTMHALPNGAAGAEAAPMRTLWRKPVVALLCAFLAVAIGLSRIYVGVHHPTDVLGGWLAGVATGLLIGMAVVQMVNSGRAADLELAAARRMHAKPDAADRAAARIAESEAARTAGSAAEPAAEQNETETIE
ncbi:MAG: phosphatase PAP2 family protein [Clostridiales bacterium]|nr:phosphatase PAP2 family protein [Clostridiales bacterium]